MSTEKSLTSFVLDAVLLLLDLSGLLLVLQFRAAHLR